MLELKHERQKGGSDRNFDHFALGRIANQDTQGWRVDSANGLARIGVNAGGIRCDADQLSAVPAIKHVVPGPTENFQRGGVVKRPREWQVELESLGARGPHQRLGS